MTCTLPTQKMALNHATCRLMSGLWYEVKEQLNVELLNTVFSRLNSPGVYLK